jgi:hypothetical protein
MNVKTAARTQDDIIRIASLASGRKGDGHSAASPSDGSVKKSLAIGPRRIAQQPVN